MDKKQIIFHIDVNSAFLSWSAIRMLKEGYSEDIRNIPAVIGGDVERRHGIVLAKSIPAKKYGIHTAMPIVQALSRCPDLLVVPPDHYYYVSQSIELMELLKSFTPNIEQASIDECYMDYTGISNTYDSPEEAAYAIKDKVKKKLGFTVNIGISDVKVLAKMASDFTKPDRVHTLYSHEIEEKMWPLPVEDLFLAGKSTVKVLHKLGIVTIGDLANTPQDILKSHLKSGGVRLHNFANGIDDSTVNMHEEDLKGVGNSTTLPKDYSDIDEINKVLLFLADKVGGRLRRYNQTAQTVAIEIKYNDFKRITRQQPLNVATDSGREIYEVAKKLFEENWNQTPVRLLGIRTTNLLGGDDPKQLSFFDLEHVQKQSKTPKPSHEKLKKLDQAIDSIKAKYGEDKIKRATFADQGKKE